MEFTSVPIIVVCCYVIGEIYKIIFKKKKETYKIIPIVLSVIGGILGVLIFLSNPELIFNVDNFWVALVIGIVSGLSSTGTNQIIKQITKREEI